MNSKKKIIQVIPNLGLGGAEIMVEHLTMSLIEDGFDVSIISLYDYRSPITTRLEDKNVPIYYLGKKKGIDIRVILKLLILFLQKKPDVVHTHLYSIPYVIPAAIIARIPIKLHTIHNIAEKEARQSLRKINNVFYKLCKVIPVAISPTVKKSIIREYKLLNNQVPMIYNGIDLTKCIVKKEYKNESGIITILHIGRFAKQKNHICLIESFKLVHDKVPNTVLKLIGGGDLEEEIRYKVKELGLEDSVQFLGLQANVYPYLNEADIFVLPSLWEGMPITLIEAMATGLPVVATGVGGVPDIIHNNVTGLVVDVDREQIAETLLKLIDDQNLREKLGKAARFSANQFSAKIMAKKYAELYNEQFKAD